MNYFLINNNYHYLDFLGHKDHLSKKNIALIEIPHTLDKRNHDDIKLAYRYEVPHFNGLLGQVFNFLSTTKKINCEIYPTQEDVLFFYTEYEILNQYIADKFKRVGARVFIIEDGGLGTYVPFRFTESEPLTVKEWVKKSVYRCLPGLSKIRFLKSNGFIFPQIEDETIDAVCLYNKVSLGRNIKTKLLLRNVRPIIGKIYGRVIFLNEPIYQIYQKDAEYIVALKLLVQGLCLGYNEVFFKFHPRETIEWREKIRKDVLAFNPNVQIIEEDGAIESLIEKYKPAAVASYFCSALLTLADRGVEPIYLYHLIPELNRQPACEKVSLILSELGYKFVSDISEVGSEYKTEFVEITREHDLMSLADILAGQ